METFKNKKNNKMETFKILKISFSEFSKCLANTSAFFQVFLTFKFFVLTGAVLGGCIHTMLVIIKQLNELITTSTYTERICHSFR